MDKMLFKKLFEGYLSSMNIELNNEQFDKLYIYMMELIEWNKKFNLTSITEYEEIILKHFVDSLMIEKYILGSSFLDIGTGAGFPGVPVKIYKDNLKVTLLDSLNKRINFLNFLIDKLNLTGVEAIHARAEELGNNKQYREEFDNVSSRAVANLEVLVELMLPFVKVGGRCIIMKGQNVENIDSVKAKISLLGGRIHNVYEYTLPLTDMLRNVIIISKEKQTPKGYPRKFNKIKPSKE